MPHDDGCSIAAKLLRGARKEAGLTIIQLAKRLDVTKGYISRVENGWELVSIPRLVQWLREVGLTNGDLSAHLNMRQTGALYRLKLALDLEAGEVKEFCLEDFRLRDRPAGTNAAGKVWFSHSAKPSKNLKPRRRHPHAQ